MNRMIIVVMLLVFVVTGCQQNPELKVTPEIGVAPAPTKTPVVTPKKLVSPKPVLALPWWGDPNFPIIHISKPMDPLQIMAFGLRPAVLTEEWVALNWYEDRGGFHLDTLPIGTIVLVDQGGRVQYKYDCSNRLVPPTSDVNSWPATSMVLPTTGPTTALPTSTYQKVNNWLSRISGRVGSFFD